MRSFQHTPAPWTARGNLETGLSVYAEGSELCQLFCIDGDVESEANARLIAAAPLMFNELQRFIERDEKEAAEAGEHETPWLDSARALLRQIQGKTHPHIGVGFCAVCEHYGDDCTGETP